MREESEPELVIEKEKSEICIYVKGGNTYLVQCVMGFSLFFISLSVRYRNSLW
jgi:hypothetical protein